MDAGANTKTAFHDVVFFLSTELSEYKLFESCAKCLVTIKSPTGKVVSVSVKSGCSQLSSSVNGEIKLLPDIDIVLYAPDFLLGKDTLSQLRVFTKDEFLEMWNTLGLIRKKVSTAALKQYRELYGPDFKTDIDKHADVISVQSFSNSGKKSKLVQDACKLKPMFLEEGLGIIKGFLTE